MKIGEWLLLRREEKDLDLRTLARAANIHASTISRIERGLMDPTISTVVNISHALNAKPEDFYRTAFGKEFDDLTSPAVLDHKLLTLEDVIDFERLVMLNPKMVGSIVSERLNQIQDAIPETFTFPEISPFTFSPNALFSLVRGTPLYEISLQYPSSMSAGSILQILRKGGLIIRYDVCAYHTQKYIEKSLEPQIIDEKEKILGIRRSSLFKKTGSKIKLSEVIRADKILGENGEILIMSWKAFEFEREAKLNFLPVTDASIRDGKWWNLQNLKYGYMLILLSRWSETLELSGADWLNDVRSHFIK